MSNICLSSNCSNYISGPLGQIFTSSIQFLFAAQRLLKEDWPEDSYKKITDWRFDYIVIGAGSAGCVLAARLTEDPDITVLIVEAGGNPPFESQFINGWPTLLKSQYDWDYQTENDFRTCKGFQNERCYLPRGKMLGGSSSINVNMYCRGHFTNYDDLEAAGNVGWNAKSAVHYFKKSEHLFDQRIERDPKYQSYHSYYGLLGVSSFNGTSPMIDPVIQAYKEMGLKEKLDISDLSNYGIIKMLGTTEGSMRESTARAFLVPSRDRKNLYILKNTLATKVIFNRKTAFGVNIRNPCSKEISIKAKKEVIISGGTINTPQILMLSGIGPKDHLNEFSIPVIKDLPVGENLHDHYSIPIFISINKGASIIPETKEAIALNVVEYITSRGGSYSNLGLSELFVFFDSDNICPNFAKAPNVVIINNLLGRNSSAVQATCRDVMVLKDQICDSLVEYSIDNDIYFIYVVLLNSESKGSIKLNSTNPADHPKIQTNAFTVEEDYETLIKVTQFVERLINTTVMKRRGAEMIKPNIPDCNMYEWLSLEYWKCYIFHLGSGFYHPMGTAKMGPKWDPKAVVDPSLKVYGVKNLRVVDASIFPGIISCNTNAPTIMMAERAADLIKADQKNY